MSKELEKAIEKCKEIRDARICLPGLREGARALDLVIEAAELTIKYKRLCINAEACKHCCPCPHKDFCPQESLYQEIKCKLGLTTKEGGKE